jgi:hypothetical protein
VSYVAALKNPTQPHPRKVAESAPAGVENSRVPPPAQQRLRQQIDQSVQADNVNSASLNNMFRVTTVVQQIMTGLNEAVSEEKKIVAITKIVLKLMNSNGC